MLKQDLRCTPRFCPVDQADVLVFTYPFHFHGYRQLKEEKRNLNKLLNLTGHFEFLSNLESRKVAVFETTWNTAKSPWEQGLGRALHRGREDAILSVVIVYFCHPHTEVGNLNFGWRYGHDRQCSRNIRKEERNLQIRRAMDDIWNELERSPGQTLSPCSWKLCGRI